MLFQAPFDFEARRDEAWALEAGAYVSHALYKIHAVGPTPATANLSPASHKTQLLSQSASEARISASEAHLLRLDAAREQSKVLVAERRRERDKQVEQSTLLLERRLGTLSTSGARLE